MGKKLALVIAIAAGAAASAVAPAAAVDLPPVTEYGLDGDEHVEFLPFADATHVPATMTTADAGDINGDGYDDVATGFSSGDPAYPDHVQIVFSNPLLRVPVQVGDVPVSGFRIDLDQEGLRYGIKALGDVNGDGHSDLALLGDESVVVVFGKSDPLPVDVSDLGDKGFRIVHVAHGNMLGSGYVQQNTTFDTIGDQNGDGRRGADLLVGGRGRDRLYGGPGDDRLNTRDGVRDLVYCGTGDDTVRADSHDRLRGCEAASRH